jgi:hypothetical protein
MNSDHSLELSGELLVSGPESEAGEHADLSPETEPPTLRMAPETTLCGVSAAKREAAADLDEVPRSVLPPLLPPAPVDSAESHQFSLLELTSDLGVSPLFVSTLYPPEDAQAAGSIQPAAATVPPASAERRSLAPWLAGAALIVSIVAAGNHTLGVLTGASAATERPLVAASEAPAALALADGPKAAADAPGARGEAPAATTAAPAVATSELGGPARPPGDHARADAPRVEKRQAVAPRAAKPEVASRPGAIEQGKPGPEAAAAPAAAAPQIEFNVGEARAAMASAASSASASCKPDDGSGGTARVSVTFAPSGRSTVATVQSTRFAGTPTGSCIASRFRGLTISPFSGPAKSVVMTVSIR